MENTRQPIPLRIRQHLRDAVGRMHPSVSFVSCIGVLLAYLTGVYITGSLHEASRWMGAMLACTSLVVVLQSHNYKDSLRAGWTRVLGTFLGALVAYIYLKIWPFSIVGCSPRSSCWRCSACWSESTRTTASATITLLIILLVSQMTPHVSRPDNCLLRFTESVVGVGVGVALLWVLERWKRWLEPQEGADTSTDKNMNMDTMPLRWGHFRVLIVASLGQITGAGLATLVGVILPMIQIFRHPGLTSLQQGLVAATSLVGIMVGSVLFGAWSDKKGYLFFFRFCPALILAASLFTFFTADLFGLVTGLFFMGLGIGGGYSLDSGLHLRDHAPAVETADGRCSESRFVVGQHRSGGHLFFPAAGVARSAPVEPAAAARRSHGGRHAALPHTFRTKSRMAHRPRAHIRSRKGRALFSGPRRGDRRNPQPPQ